MASSHQYSSSADLYPPIRHNQYDPITYPAASASASFDYLGDANQSQHNLAGSHQGYNHSPMNSPYGTAGAAGSRYGEKFSDADDGDDGPPQAMLGASRGYRDASSAGGKKGGAGGFFANKRKRNWIIAIIILLIAIIVAAVVGCIVASRNSSSSSSNRSNSGISSGSNDSGSHSGSNSKDAIENSALTGTNGSQITMENGQTFTYINNFGGHWVSTPFDDSARPQSWSPALNESWDYTNMKCVYIRALSPRRATNLPLRCSDL